MEKLKIRVKDAKTGEVLAYEILSENHWTNNIVSNNGYYKGLYQLDNPRLTRQQFTGKKDHEGAEVYEGDIVQTTEGKGVVKRQGCEFFIDLFRDKSTSLSLSDYWFKVVAKKNVPIEDVVKQVLENLAESPITGNLTIDELKDAIIDFSRFINHNHTSHIKERNEAVLRLAALCLHTSKIIQENEQ